MNEPFEFAGFTFPKQVAMLPRGTWKQRLEHKRNPTVGPYFTSPSPNPQGTSFYLDSDFMPELRWEWCDEVAGVRIDHTGWFTNQFQDDKIRGLVMRLPHGRGFLAGWSMGKSMASEVEYHIYDEQLDAAYAADSLAEHVAERQREFEEEQDRELRESEDEDAD